MAKILGYNSLIHGKKRDYLYATSKPETMLQLRNLISSAGPCNYLTRPDLFAYLLVLFPYLDHHRGQDQLDIEYLAQIPKMELVALCLKNSDIMPDNPLQRDE